MIIRGPYAITGGMGGLGLRTAEMLAEGGASGAVLISRSGRLAGPAVNAEKRAMKRVAASGSAGKRGRRSAGLAGWRLRGGVLRNT